MIGACGCENPRCRLNNDDHRHGTPNGYRNQSCRCYRCRFAHTNKCAEEKALRIARGVPEYVHGTVNGYANYGCRTPGCCQPHKRQAYTGYRPGAPKTMKAKVTQK